MGIVDEFEDSYADKIERFSFAEYLEICKDDPSAYTSAAERLLKAIGEPKIVDTQTDPILSRIFSNRRVKIYDKFADFYGIEEVIENIVNFLRFNAQNLEESKSILYLLGPVGSSKSSLVERLKELTEKEPLYVIENSPVFDNPLNVFWGSEHIRTLEAKYGIPKYAVRTCPSPWLVQQLKDLGGKISQLKVLKIHPSRLDQRCIAKVEPGDENNTDISNLVGKVDIRKLEEYPQNHPYAYSYSGGLCRANRGLMDFVECFKAPIKMLNPLLTATQERNYNSVESIGSLPFEGIVCAHCFSEDTEILTKNGWKTYKEINKGDILATLNLETNKLEYQPAIEKYVYDYDGIMFHFKTRSAMDHLVTPNHKMIYQTQYTDNWNLVTAGEWQHSGQHVAVSAENILPDYLISDDMLRLIVQLITDGSISNNYLRWHLRKSRKINRLKNLLNRLNIEYKCSLRSDNTVEFYMKNTFNLVKDIPAFYNELSARQCRIFLEEYSYTDGSRNNSSGRVDYNNPDNVTHYQLSTNKKDYIDKLQHMAFCAGYKSNYCSCEYDNENREYKAQNFLSIRLDINVVSADYAKTETKYRGKVFCFETPNHTLVARRNGKVIVTGNSNEQEWQQFKANKANEAIIDRITLIKVPYCLRSKEEIRIYEKLLNTSTLHEAPCAPWTLDLLAKFCVLSRLKDTKNSTLYSKLRVYDGENIKDIDPKAKPIQEYRDEAGVTEGMNGISTRFAFKVLSKTFNFDSTSIGANPVHLMYLLKKEIAKEQYGKETEEKLNGFIDSVLHEKYLDVVDRNIRTALMNSHQDYCQTMFEKYVMWADCWLRDEDFRDESGLILDKNALNAECEKLEKAGLEIANPREFRSETVTFVLRHRASHNGKAPRWNSYAKIRDVIEKMVLNTTESFLPIISFSPKASDEDKKKHSEFITAMKELGYDHKAARIVCEWYLRVRKAS